MKKVCFSQINLLLLCYVFLPLELPSYQVNTFFPLPGNSFPLPWKSQFYLLPGKYPFSTPWEISISTLYQINTFFHFWGTSYFHFWGTDIWPSHKPILNSLMRKVCFSQINLLLLCYFFLPLELTFYQVNTFFPLLGELVSTSWAISSITLYQMNTFFHFKGTSCFLFLRSYMWPSHQTIFFFFLALLWGKFALPT